MVRKYKVNEIHLEIIDLIPFTNKQTTGFIIEWRSDIGYGEYTIYKKINTNIWMADAEMMDSNEDKDFIKELMKLFIEKLEVLL